MDTAYHRNVITRTFWARLIVLLAFAIPLRGQGARNVDSLERLAQGYESGRLAQDTAFVTLLRVLSAEYAPRNIAKAFLYARRAKEVAETLQDARSQAAALYAVGYAYREQGNRYEALAYFFDALKASEECQDTTLRIQILSGIGLAYSDARKYVVARRYVRQALQLATVAGNEYEQADALANMGVIYRALGDNTEALEYFVAERSLAQKIGNDYLLSNALYSIGSVYERQHRYGEALASYERSLALKRRQNEWIGATYCYRGYGSVYLGVGNHKKALLYARLALKLTDSLGVRLAKPQTLELLSDIYTAMGDGKTAFRFYKEAIALQDSLDREQRSRNTDDIQAEYEAYKHAKELEALKIEERRQETVRNTAIAAVVALLAFAGILVNRYRLKANIAKVLEETNIELLRQQSLLEEQARHIEIVNTELEEKNRQLKESNLELDAINEELYKANSLLDSNNEQLYRSNERLYRANEQLEALNLEKNEFLGIAAHDLRNPLAAIQLTLEILQKYGNEIPPTERDKHHENVLERARHMRSILTNLLDLNVIESGALNAAKERCDLAEITARVASDYAQQAAKKNIALRFPAAAAPIAIEADPELTREVVDNIVSNALKYSLPGSSVWIEFTTAANAACLRVRDEGPGLTEEDKKRLGSVQY